MTKSLSALTQSIKCNRTTLNLLNISTNNINILLKKNDENLCSFNELLENINKMNNIIYNSNNTINNLIHQLSNAHKNINNINNIKLKLKQLHNDYEYVQRCIKITRQHYFKLEQKYRQVTLNNIDLKEKLKCKKIN